MFLGLKTETSVERRLRAPHASSEPHGDEGFELAAGAARRGRRLPRRRELRQGASRTFTLLPRTRGCCSCKRTETRLLAVFQIGATSRDVKVFRWAIDATGRADLRRRPRRARTPRCPAQHDFEWTRDHAARTRCAGKHPHVDHPRHGVRRDGRRRSHDQGREQHQDGQGIYREPVDDANQSLDDAEISYRRSRRADPAVVKPFREHECRYLVFNTRTKRVVRIDAIGQAASSCPRITASSSPAATSCRRRAQALRRATRRPRVRARCSESPTARTCSTSSPARRRRLPAVPVQPDPQGGRDPDPRATATACSPTARWSSSARRGRADARAPDAGVADAVHVRPSTRPPRRADGELPRARSATPTWCAASRTRYSLRRLATSEHADAHDATRT